MRKLFCRHLHSSLISTVTCMLKCSTQSLILLNFTNPNCCVILLVEQEHVTKSYQLSRRNFETVIELVFLGRLPGPLDQNSVVRPHATVDHADVISDLEKVKRLLYYT